MIPLLLVVKSLSLSLCLSLLSILYSLLSPFSSLLSFIYSQPSPPLLFPLCSPLFILCSLLSPVYSLLSIFSCPGIYSLYSTLLSTLSTLLCPLFSLLSTFYSPPDQLHSSSAREGLLEQTSFREALKPKAPYPWMKAISQWAETK